MSKIVFVPLTDEMVFERPEMITGPITAYQSAGFETTDMSLTNTESRQLPGVYLKGDLLKGLDVLYIDNKPIRSL